MGFNEYHECRLPDCRRPIISKISGMCAGHQSNWAGDHTSDGKRTGLTADQVAEARRMLSAFKTRRAIAAHFGVSVGYLRKCLQGDAS